ncbi:MAG: proline racemase family protein [Vicinamibacteria bacterium]|nr:proline racemase family protein [Vicinamibacteria bacterium]
MSFAFPGAIEIVDSHTEGEPTRVVVDGWPQPPGTTMAERREFLRVHQDHLRRAVVLEPRGHEAIVGALLTPPVTPGSVAGVIFFNDVGTLGMCGHGLIGVVRTLGELGRLGEGRVQIDTPVGPVRAAAEGPLVTIENVPARCARRDVSVDVPGLGRVTGDVAWGGNWFFLTSLPDQRLAVERASELVALTTSLRDALAAAGIAGDDGAAIDHVELFAPPRRADADSLNFVLCPGAAWDRSPCGTGTSAKMAVLHARGQLAAGARWRQEGLAGGMFEGWLEERDGQLVPHLRGRAFVTSRASLRFDPTDPFRAGFV